MLVQLIYRPEMIIDDQIARLIECFNHHVCITIYYIISGNKFMQINYN